ncbi:MAG: DAK2 domain-containing protein [Anaerolineae bacterium]|jgi:hypothetical protein|nr:DAK2 domain-containing protein [Anaerolineae bacterium]
MVVEIKRQVCDGHLLKWLMAAGLAWLENHRKQVNDLNVFPVPDGDTGTNMTLTLQKAYEAIAQMDESHFGVVSAAVAHGALRGARGNSGTILSQLFAGFAESVRGHEYLDLPLLVTGVQRGVEKAYQAVSEPVEGTILTVAREAMEAVTAFDPASRDLKTGFEVLLQAAYESLQRTPDLLPRLKQAGVVDSGGQGLVYILEGMSRLLHGEPITIRETALAQATPDDWQEALLPEDEEGYGYDVQFLIHGEQLDVNQVRHDIEAMGWSALVVGDEALIKVHVHVHDPGQPLSYAIGLGAQIDDIVVENMQLQYQSYVQARIDRHDDQLQAVEGVAVIAVASGDGLRDLLKNEFGVAAVISGGQTMNPSTEDFLAVIDRLSNHEIILLPNNKNIQLAAEQAAELARNKQVRVIPTKTIPQGIAALMEYVNLRDEPMETIFEGMREGMREVVTCEITTATRDALIDGVEVREGQYIALINGQLRLAESELTTAVTQALQKAGAGDYELITVYYGQQVKPQQATSLQAHLSEQFANQEIFLVNGGQPLYPYLISLE